MQAKFFKLLKIVGIGNKGRAEAGGRLLVLKLGYSHDVEVTVPPAVRVFCFDNHKLCGTGSTIKRKVNTVLCCAGIDKQRVHQFAAAVRSIKPPDVYDAKGILYIDEYVKLKPKKEKKSHK